MSEYFKNLSKTAKRRYEEKLNDIGVENVEKSDPFLSSGEWVDDVTKWPEVEFGQIYVYLIDSPGPYTRENMKTYRSLDAYQQFFYGWVRTCFLLEINNTVLLKAKVMRSQAVTDTPHEAWCALDKSDATVLTGHCTCMAGQGEMCTHVAALLFKAEACTRLGFNKVSCTSVPCTWNQNYTKKVEAAIIQEISFRKPKRGNFHLQLQDIVVDQQPVQFADTTSFLEKLKKSNKSAVIFSVTDPKPQPKLSGPSLPTVLTQLYNTDNVILAADELNAKCKSVFEDMNVTIKQAEKLEAMTRQQSNCSLWYQFRKGRLTASNFHEITHSDTEVCSSTTLLKKVMHYNASFNSYATDWGIKNEQNAIEQYKLSVSKDHTNFQVRKCGLIVNEKYPYLAASPDAMVSCDCCGSGVIEVKCPFSHRDSTPCDINDQGFFLTKHSHSEPVCSTSLKSTHKHYSQVQGQINLAEVGYCDFVVWTNEGIHIERISTDKQYFEEMLIKLKAYFVNIALPELLTNRLKSEIESSKAVTSYCFCGENEDYDNMIACDSKICPKEWYHLSCVGLKESPTGKWFCLTCKNTKGGKRKKLKK